jgi:uncharacterized protein YceH (UPF0502 family)
MLNLSTNETRVIGCLMEKSVTTPDLYPLTLNSLTNACNQKSGRNPAMSLAQGEVQHTVRNLNSNNLVYVEENFKRGVEKYKQRFCNTSFGELQFDAAQFAIICLLLLRGAQTPGELRARSGRLHEFADNTAVVESLNGLIQREGGALVEKLPRTPGRKDAEYMHLFSGTIDHDEYVKNAEAEKSAGSSDRVSLAELALRVSSLEAEVAELKKRP